MYVIHSTVGQRGCERRLKGIQRLLCTLLRTRSDCRGNSGWRQDDGIRSHDQEGLPADGGCRYHSPSGSILKDVAKDSARQFHSPGRMPFVTCFGGGANPAHAENGCAIDLVTSLHETASLRSEIPVDAAKGCPPP